MPLPQDFNCSSSVTPPAHGPNDLDLDQPDGVNPQKVVQWHTDEFSFVANPSQCKMAGDLNTLGVYPYCTTDKEMEEAEKKWAKIPIGNGTLRVLDS